MLILGKEGRDTPPHPVQNSDAEVVRGIEEESVTGGTPHSGGGSWNVEHTLIRTPQLQRQDLIVSAVTRLWSNPPAPHKLCDIPSQYCVRAYHSTSA